MDINNLNDIDNTIDIDILFNNNFEILSLSTIINLIKNIDNNNENNNKCIFIIKFDIELYNEDFINIREYLLKICDVKEIIYLPFGIYKTNTKLCIFNMIKKRNENFIYNNNKKITEVHQTKIINFYEYNYFDNNKNLLVSANIKKIINNDYSFNYTNYIEIEPIISIKNKINDYVIIEYGTKVNNKFIENLKKYKIYGNNEKYNKYSNFYNRNGFNIIITKYTTYLIDEKIFLNNYGASIKSKSELLLDKYLGYYLYYNNINLKTLDEITIPSIKIQNEIINYIDNINNNILKLNNEISELNLQCLKIIKNI